MSRKLSSGRREALIRDIFTAEYDVVALAEAHNLSPDDLAAWSNMPENQQCLRGLCMVADVQTQLLLSRFRLSAALRLIQLATQVEKDEQTDDKEPPPPPPPPDVARKACVDLLRLDLKRVDQKSADVKPGEPSEDLAALRKALYGSNERERSAKKPASK